VLQTVIVAAIVAAATFFVVRPLLPKALRSRKGGCACGKEGDQPRP